MTLPDWIKGAKKSLTVWFAVLLAAAPEVLVQLQANFDAVAPFIPKVAQPRLLQLVALGIFLLRMKTTVSLSEKVQPKG